MLRYCNNTPFFSNILNKRKLNISDAKYCFIVKDIKLVIKLIVRNIQIFSDLSEDNFFTKTFGGTLVNEYDNLSKLNKIRSIFL